MTLPSPHGRLALATLLAFGLTLALLLLVNGDPLPAPEPARAPLEGPTGRTPGPTDAQIARLQAELRADPGASGGQLATAYLQKARETGDAAFYARAERLLRQAAERAPRDPGVLVGQGTLALARHDFAAALTLARRAHRLAPGTLAPYPVLVDALVELGRYGEAQRELQRMVDLKPSLPAYARISYFRELHGDLPGAADAMALAVSAGGAAPEAVAFARSQLGDLELARGRLAAAHSAFAGALAAVPGYVPALAGQARLAARRGELGSAIRAWRRIVARLPLPEHVVGLAEAELAAGRLAAGRRDLALVRAQKRLLGGAGVNTDVELAVFEADHGSPRRALAMARRAWASAPSVRSADALGWALVRSGRPREGLAWARQALRLGSVDASFLAHAG
ncbi:MAG: tetratricopeptide repeat protein, partial [Actinomycetota bacterium]|nr:tetratricopeptide repeat protein [Actinomycetota bacterium]